MNNIIILIIGMMLVTYIPRLLPFIIMSDNEIQPDLKKFLEYIPYTALGALIIPGVFSAIEELPQASLLGIGFCLIYAWYKGGIIIPVIGSILVAFLTLLLN
ncbi:AzlD domain-containing protein [Vallitalea sediminicola]